MTFHWIHHLINPHCSECRDEKLEDKVCKSCEVALMQLAIANQEKERLLQALLDRDKPQIQPERTNEPLKQPIAFRGVPWAVRRQMLEAEDREAAKVMRNKVEERAKLAPQNDSDQKRIEELEKELGIEEGA